MSPILARYLSPFIVDDWTHVSYGAGLHQPGGYLETPATSALSSLSDDDRARAFARFQVIRPFLEDGIPLARVAREQRIILRTARRWVKRYRSDGLAGLARKERGDKAQRKLSTGLQQLIEGLALRKPSLSAAMIHRKAAEAAKNLGERPPSYTVVYRVISKLEPALLTMAHEGTKAYSDRFELVHRREAEAPNAIWQADHTELDILVKDDESNPRKPWLTIILDDYSRAVAGYLLFFTAPSAIQTALALRQAIWRKSQAGWHICGIPQILYTDHGSDFTSQHIEQVVADLKIRLIFSTVAKPRGRGKIERFFRSVSQVFLSGLPGYGPGRTGGSAVLTLPELAQELERYLIHEYLVAPHSETGQAPQARWDAGGFLPHMPESLEQLDLLLLTVPRTRRVRPDGIHFMSMRYIDPTLAAYVGEDVLLRYDPRDVAEIRVFYQDRFLCRAICQELAGETVPLREIVSARNRRKRELRQTVKDRRRVVDSLWEAKHWGAKMEQIANPSPEPSPQPVKLKRYFCDE
jgi:putative transposase